AVWVAGTVTCSVDDHGPAAPAANCPCAEPDASVTETSFACAADRLTCMPAEGCPAVSVCAPVAKDREAGGMDVPVGVTPKIHVRHAVDDGDPFARLYWFASQTAPL